MQLEARERAVSELEARMTEVVSERQRLAAQAKEVDTLAEATGRARAAVEEAQVHLCVCVCVYVGGAPACARAASAGGCVGWRVGASSLPCSWGRCLPDGHYSVCHLPDAHLQH